MTAIPTEYNGTLYRSKLEAKWAAYFDLCGASFEYEPQAFDLGDGVKYLPDFLVSNVFSVHGGCGDQTIDNSFLYERFWFECKGLMTDYDTVKISRFRKNLLEEHLLKNGVTPGWTSIDCNLFKINFFVLDMSPSEMFNSFDNISGKQFEFGPIDGDDDYPFVIGRPFDRDGIGLFGGDCNYQSLMHKDSREYANTVDEMFRYVPKSRA